MSADLTDAEIEKRMKVAMLKMVEGSLGADEKAYLKSRIQILKWILGEMEVSLE